MLAGVLLKMGTYGFLRFAVPMFPQAAVDLAPLLLVARGDRHHLRRDRRRDATQPETLVAYSSVAHLGFVVLGIFALTQQSIQGGLFTMLSHGLTTGALFLLVGMLYERRHTYEISDYRGLWKAIPVFGGLFVIATFASIGLPGLLGLHRRVPRACSAGSSPAAGTSVVATTGVILAAVYMLWAVQRTLTGEPDGETRTIREVSLRELCTVVPLLGLSLFLGFYPKPVLDRVQPSRRAPRRTTSRTTATTRSPRSATKVRRSPTTRVASDPVLRRAGGPRRSDALDRLARDRAVHRAVRRGDRHRARTALLRQRSVGRGSRAARRVRWASLTSGVFTFVQWHIVDRDGPYQAIAGMVAVDGFAVFVKTVVLLRHAARTLLVGRVPAARAARGTRVLRADAVLGHGHDADGVGERPHHRLPCARDPLDRAVRARRVRPPSPHVAGSRPQVLPAGLVLLRDLPLRRRARLRRDRHTNLTKIAHFLATTTLLDDGVLLLGFALLLVGLGFKVAAAPFHMWTPDVYQGAPTPVTAFMAGATKAAAFGAMLRVLLGAFDLYRVDWRPAIWGLAVLSLLVGTIAALVQTDVKRMLAYSSIGHAGYILIGVQAATRKERAPRSSICSRTR